MSAVEWRNLQREDSAISRVIEMLKVPNNNNTADENPMVNLLLKKRHHLLFRDDILFRHRLIDGMEMFQLVLPSVMRPRVLRGLHDDMGHLGRDKTIDLVCQRFYWPRMTVDIESHIRDCQRCIMRKTADPPRAPTDR